MRASASPQAASQQDVASPRPASWHGARPKRPGSEGWSGKSCRSRTRRHRKAAAAAAVVAPAAVAVARQTHRPTARQTHRPAAAPRTRRHRSLAARISAPWVPPVHGARPATMKGGGGASGRAAGGDTEKGARVRHGGVLTPPCLTLARARARAAGELELHTCGWLSSFCMYC